MGQARAVAATTDTRRWSRGARALLVLGGSVVVWFALSSAPASADDGTGPLRETTRALTAALEEVTQPTRQAAQPETVASSPETRSTPRTSQEEAPRRTSRPAPVQPVAEVVRAVRTSPVVTTVRETVRATVAATPVAPVLTAVTTTVRTQLEPVVERTQDLLRPTPLAPVTADLGLPETDAVVDLPVLSPSAATPGAVTADPRSTPAASSSPAAEALLVSDFLAQPDTAPAGLDRAALGTAGAPLEHRPAETLGSLGAGSATAQSGSGAGPAAAALEAGVVVRAATVPAPASPVAAEPATGPAYPPAASPD